ncbi:MAG: hypothetical protein K2X39_03660 [Silvanigrellaceae bacterium]|nr:hypothetical protein [Silvanigrellaceae bacterium]
MSNGWWSNLFFKQKDLKYYDKYGDVLKKTPTTKEQREEAIEALSDLPPEFAIPQLLKRFEIVVDHGLLDIKEKEKCLKIIVGFGEKAKSFIVDSLKSKKRISWQIKIAEKIFSPEDYLTLLIENMSLNMAEFDEAALERNIEILLALKEIKNIKIIPLASSYFKCRDEGVRMAALECMEEQVDVDEQQVKDILLNLAKQEKYSDDNSRFLGLLDVIIARHGWGSV